VDWVVTDDILKETWSRLLEFANIDVAVNAIASRHGPASTSALRQNYQKQAQQIRSCLLQSREYFEAASISSLITSPNHAYYGLVALASSIMLMRGDGGKSLDIVRQDRSNRNHGMSFSTSIRRTSAISDLKILKDSFIEVRPSGNLSIWYEVLPEKILNCGKTMRVGEKSTHTTFGVVGVTPSLPFAKLVGTKKSVLDLMKYCPDLNGELRRYGVSPTCSRFNHEKSIFVRDGKVLDSWSIHGAGSPSALEELLKAFKVSARNIGSMSVNMEDGDNGGIISYEFKREDFPIALNFPSSRVSLSLENICYADEIDTHEFVDMYMTAFGLSMLARYFPDLWVSCLESNCLSAKLIEKLSAVLVKKAPMLGLSLLSGRECFISTHRQPWAP